jgi:hypothetical protein
VATAVVNDTFVGLAFCASLSNGGSNSNNETT